MLDDEYKQLDYAHNTGGTGFQNVATVHLPTGSGQVVPTTGSSTAVVGDTEEDEEEGEEETPESKIWQYSVENSFPTSTPQTSIGYDDPYLAKRATRKSIDEMQPGELQLALSQEWKEATEYKKVAREKGHRAEMLEDRCKLLGIAIPPDVMGGRSKYPVISAISQESGDSKFYFSLLEYADIIERAAEKVRKYKVPTKLDDKFAKAIKEMVLVWRPWVDEKYRKDTFSWLYVAMDEAAHGKHAAATMHSTQLEDGIKRALTREQVGDKKEAVYQQALRIIAVWKDLGVMHRWHYETQEKAIANRAIRLRPRLSEQA